MELSEQQKIEYIAYAQLPSMTTNTVRILEGFASANWKRNFESLTQLRSCNRHSPQEFASKLIKEFMKDILFQVDNLRSNNSKEALTLLHQFLRYNKAHNLEEGLFGEMLTKLFIKSCSEKGFLKTEAREAIKILPTVGHSALPVQLSRQTQSPNYLISELAIITLRDTLKVAMITKQNQGFAEFLRILAKNILGKRTLIEKTAKQIVGLMQKSYGNEVLVQIINNTNLSEQQKKQLTSEIQRQQKEQNNSKKQQQNNFKDFLKQKKQQTMQTE